MSGEVFANGEENVDGMNEHDLVSDEDEENCLATFLNNMTIASQAD